jgi:hypothetical protein
VRLNTDPIDLGAPFGVRDGTAFDGIENEQINFTNVMDWDIAGSGWILASLTGWRDNENRFGTDSDHSDAFRYFGPIPPCARRARFREHQPRRSARLQSGNPAFEPSRAADPRHDRRLLLQAEVPVGRHHLRQRQGGTVARHRPFAICDNREQGGVRPVELGHHG